MLMLVLMIMTLLFVFVFAFVLMLMFLICVEFVLVFKLKLFRTWGHNNRQDDMHDTFSYWNVRNANMAVLVDRNERDAMQVVDIDGDGFAVEKGR